MIFDLFKRKEAVDLKDYLQNGKKIKVHGIIFHIRKLNALDYLEGAKVMQETFSTYKTKEQKITQDKMAKDLKKAQSYMRDVIMGGVIKPKLTRKKDEADDGAIHVDELLQDFTLTQDLCREILEFTYGKKK